MITESKKPTPLLPPSTTQSRYETLATLFPPIKSVYIVTSSVFSNVPISYVAPEPVPTCETLAYVLESLPLKYASGFASTVPVWPFAYLTFLRPTALVFEPITCPSTLVFANASTTA